MSAPAAAPPRISSAALRRLVEVRYAAPEWLICDEAGGNYGRRVDLVAFNLWQSRGYHLVGFELKVERRDWLRELKEPAKAEESLYRFCDAWYVVAAQGIVEEAEVPAPWGWLEQKGERLFTRKKAPALTSKPVNRAVLAALLKRYEAALQSRDTRDRNLLRDEVRTEYEAQHGAMLRHRDERLAVLEERCAEYVRRFGWVANAADESAIALAKRIAGGGNEWRDGSLFGHLNQLERNLEKTVLAIATARQALLDVQPAVPA